MTTPPTTRHDPTILSSTNGSWTECSCGWTSERYRGAAGASVAFAGHLAGVRG